MKLFKPKMPVNPAGMVIVYDKENGKDFSKVCYLVRNSYFYKEMRKAYKLQKIITQKINKSYGGYIESYACCIYDKDNDFIIKNRFNWTKENILKLL